MENVSASCRCLRQVCRHPRSIVHDFLSSSGVSRQGLDWETGSGTGRTPPCHRRAHRTGATARMNEELAGSAGCSSVYHFSVVSHMIVFLNGSNSPQHWFTFATYIHFERGSLFRGDSLLKSDTSIGPQEIINLLDNQFQHRNGQESHR